MIYKCPGQDKRNITAETLKCVRCGYEKEIFSDEIKVKCPKCQSISYREVLPTCVDWCKHAKDCVGNEIYDAYTKNKCLLLKDKLIKELEGYFASDTKRIKHAKKVLDYAEELLRKEGGDWHIVVPTAILHDVGIKAAEEKYGSSAGHLQEEEGPAIAREILLKNGFRKEDIDEICDIIAHHHSPGKVTTQNFKILYDADWLVNLKEEVDTNDEAKLKNIIHKVFLTDAGRALAKELYLSGK